MSSQERTFQGRFKSLRVFALVIGVAILAAGCGGGSDTSSGFPSPPPGPGPQPGPGPAPGPTSANTVQVTAATAGVCEVAANGYTAPIAYNCSGRSYVTTTQNGLTVVDMSDTNNQTAAHIAYLNGGNSTSSDGSALTYQWTLLYAPAGSTFAKHLGTGDDLTDANTALASFSPDVAGTYKAQLVVTSTTGNVASQRIVETVTAYDATIMNAALSVGTSGYLHGGVSSSCTHCHNGTNPTVLSRSSTHIATTNVCEACHATYTFTTTPTVDHVEVLGTCTSCHDGVTATGKDQYHIPTTPDNEECSDCHDTTSWFDATFSHANVTQPCSSCHDGKTATGTNSDPNPNGHPVIGATECNACHTTTTFSTPFVNHNNASLVQGKCNSCHDGGLGQPAPAPNALGLPAAGSHPDITDPNNNTKDIECSVCHVVDTTTNFIQPNPTIFSHNFLGQYPMTCLSCHDGSLTGVRYKIKDTSADTTQGGHPVLLAGADCSDCHTTVSFNPPFTFVHDATNLSGKRCDDCHTDGTFQVCDVNDPTNCQLALGMPANHILLLPDSSVAGKNQDCGVCHTKPGGTFAGTIFDHTTTLTNMENAGLVSGCSDCHDNVIATGKSKTHVQTTLECNSSGCHDNGDYTSWGGAGFNHSSLTTSGTGAAMVATPNRCDSCHDGSQSSTVKSGTHVPVTYKDSKGNTVTVDCVACHGAAIISNSAAKFNLTQTAFDHAGIMDPSGTGYAFNCSTCHDGKAHDGLTVINRPIGHIPSDPTDCGVCHSDVSYQVTTTTDSSGLTHVTTTAGTSGFLTAGLFYSTDPTVKTTVHSKYTAGCRTCHGGSYVNQPYNAWSETNKGGTIVALTSTHDTANKANKDCNACHSVSGGFGEGSGYYDHTTFNASTDTCISCHVDNQTVEPIGRNTSSHPGTPPALNDTKVCQDCHSPGGSFTAGFDHSALNSKTGYVVDASTGKDTSVTCINCHDGVNAKGQDSSNVLDPTPDPVTGIHPPTTHIPTSRNCFVCHTTYPPAASTFAGITTGNNPVPTTFSHTAQGSEALGVDCLVCHDDSVSPEITGAYQKKDSAALGGPNPHEATNSTCSACHNGFVDFTSASVFDHTQLTTAQKQDCTNGSNCHGTGNSAGTKTVNDVPDPTYPHIPINNVNCAVCHTNPGGSFTDVTMDHTAVTSTTASSPAIACDACHVGKHQGTGGPGVGVTTKSSNHFDYSKFDSTSSKTTSSIKGCSSGAGGCHSSTSTWTTNWTSTSNIPYSHGTTYPGTHNVSKVSQCAQCHKDTPKPLANITGFPGTYNGECADCHANDFKSNNHSGGVSSNASCGSGRGCHKVTDSRFSG